MNFSEEKKKFRLPRADFIFIIIGLTISLAAAVSDIFYIKASQKYYDTLARENKHFLGYLDKDIWLETRLWGIAAFCALILISILLLIIFKTKRKMLFLPKLFSVIYSLAAAVGIISWISIFYGSLSAGYIIWLSFTFRTLILAGIALVITGSILAICSLRKFYATIWAADITHTRT